MQALLIKVLVLLPFSKTFDYICFEDVSEGDLVSLEFGKISTYGVVCEISEVPETSEFKLKEIRHVLLRGIFSKKLLELLKLASKYNCGKIGMFLRLSFPFSKFRLPEIKEEFEFEISLTETAKEDSLKSKLWKEVWEELSSNGAKPISDFKIPAKELAKFTEKNLLSLAKFSPEIKIPKLKLATLSPEQFEAFNEVKSHLFNGFKTFLLEGETGSGKTEVYFHLIQEVLNNGGQVLLMLPEIALSSAILERFKERFGFNAVLWHSSVSEKKKIANFLEIAGGKAKVIIGTRSSLFLPFKNLQLIIVDEEHDSSYKQEEIVIYNGRDMAVMRGFVFKIPVILGSATPSIESYNNIKNGKYALVSLKNRFFVKQMPKITIVDMKQHKPPRNEFISPIVLAKLSEITQKGGQAMLFLNRRGYAPVVLCGTCGGRIKCKFCDVHLTKHKTEGRLKCHHCGYVREEPKFCEPCGAEDSFRVMGAGVERIKEELEKTFPSNEIALLTSDTLTSPVKTREAIEEIESGRAKIIVGTQVVSKGYHFPNLKFVGILDADFGLNIEDFRAFEKTFQLLYQVAGRTGRETADGEVFIQTFEPKNKVLFSIINYDKEGFYNLELESRYKFKLPPFSKQVGFVVSSEEKEEALETAKTIAFLLEKEFGKVNGFSIFGPSIPILSFLRNKHRFRILILSVREFSVQERIIKAVTDTKLPNGVSLKIDVDPLSFN